MRKLRVLSSVAVICAAFTAGQPAQAGFGLFGGHGSNGGYASGGSTGGAGYGSSGGYTGGASYGGASGYGSSGSYAAAYASYGSAGGYGSSGGSVGPIRRLAAKIHAHHAAKVASRHSSGSGYGSSGSAAVYRSSYGSSGGSSSYGSSGGGSVSYSGGSSGSTSYSSGYSTSAPVMSSPEYHSYAPMMGSNSTRNSGYDSGIVAETAAPETIEATIDSDAALLTVSVPEDAKVTVNGLSTSSKGAIRQFMSNGLKEGFVYTYVVNVTFTAADKTESKTVKLRAGSTERLVFNEPSPVKTVSVPVAPETVVTLRVPASASVNLAGNDTKGDGIVRTFRTRQLADGQKWANYTIRVSMVIGGVPVTKERTIDLKAGDSHEFVFDFDAASVASR